MMSDCTEPRMNTADVGARGFSPLASRRVAGSHGRRGAVIVFVAALMVVLLGMAALTIDLGILYVARSELQRTADAAALAAALDLLDEDILKGAPYMSDEIAAATLSAVEYAQMNPVLNVAPTLDADRDVTIGYLYDPDDPNDVFTTMVDPSLYNSARVVVRRSSLNGDAILFSFANIFGHSSADLAAEATATYKNGVVGYKPTPDTGNAELMPLALHTDVWNDLITGGSTAGDNYSFDPVTGAVTLGPDGIDEINLFPGSGATQLPSGNFGTVDIGSNNNSTADLSRQIRGGISESDLAAIGGEFSVPTSVNGDTGLSAAIKDDLASVIGLPRAIPLFSNVSGNGNNSMFDIVGFGGIRVMAVKLTGSMASKHVLVQPAFVTDAAAVTGPGSGSSYYVYTPIRLTR